LYIFDVRNPEEYWAGHLPGSVWAPGGQLVQATDKYAATRNSRMVLVDDNNVRATMTASWLLQMGWKDVVVLEGGLSGDWLETGPRRAEIPGLHDAGVDEISPRELETLLANDTAVLIDLGPSPEYRQGHIPGAWFAVRSRLEKALETVPTKSRLVLTSGDGVIAWLVAGEAEELVSQPVSVLTGGTAAWAWAGLPLTKGEENMADTTNDVWLRPYDRLSGVEDAMKTYLSWEGDLVEQLQRDGSTKFRLFPDNA
jgi:rhodanese-related sulfurtransferase